MRVLLKQGFTELIKSQQCFSTDDAGEPPPQVGTVSALEWRVVYDDCSSIRLLKSQRVLSGIFLSEAVLSFVSAYKPPTISKGL